MLQDPDCGAAILPKTHCDCRCLPVRFGAQNCTLGETACSASRAVAPMLMGLPGCRLAREQTQDCTILLGPCPAEYLVAACSGPLCPPKGLASCGRASLLGACLQPPCHSGCEPAIRPSCCSTAAMFKAPGTWARILAGLASQC